MGSEFIYGVHSNPVVAAVKNNVDIQEVIESECEVVFLLNANILTITETVERLQQANKVVFIHLDLMEGISMDQYGLEYLVKIAKPDGIITTNSNLIVHGKRLNIYTIQRLFILDSLSYNRSVSNVKRCQPDAVEILPGIMHRITSQIKEDLKIPVVVGGLIHSKKDIIMALEAGAIAVSSTNKEIWKL